MITHETINRIHDIFIHLQTAGKSPVQRYDPLEEYRTGMMIAKGMDYKGNALEVYCNTEKFTKWHSRIWEKRKKEIPHPSYIEILDNGAGWRIGFRC